MPPTPRSTTYDKAIHRLFAAQPQKSMRETMKNQRKKLMHFSIQEVQLIYFLNGRKMSAGKHTTTDIVVSEISQLW